MKVPHRPIACHGQQGGIRCFSGRPPTARCRTPQTSPPDRPRTRSSVTQATSGRQAHPRPRVAGIGWCPGADREAVTETTATRGRWGLASLDIGRDRRPSVGRGNVFQGRPARRQPPRGDVANGGPRGAHRVPRPDHPFPAPLPQMRDDSLLVRGVPSPRHGIAAKRESGNLCPHVAHPPDGDGSPSPRAIAMAHLNPTIALATCLLEHHVGTAHISLISDSLEPTQAPWVRYPQKNDSQAMPRRNSRKSVVRLSSTSTGWPRRRILRTISFKRRSAGGERLSEPSPGRNQTVSTGQH